MKIMVDYGIMKIYVEDGAREITEYIEKNKNQKVWVAIRGRTPKSELRNGKKRKRERENQIPNKKSKEQRYIGDEDYLNKQAVLTYMEKGEFVVGITNKMTGYRPVKDVLEFLPDFHS